MSPALPFAGLAPECILDALESVGFRCDGGLLALNSYENRVWQIGIEDSAPLIVKFYRPGRWSDAQIAEEHAFVATMLEAELPVVAPLVIHGQTLFTHADPKTDSIFRFAVYPRQGGRAPEFCEPQVLQWMGRLMARIHLVGEREPFIHRETLDMQSFGIEPRDWLLANQTLPPELKSVWQSVADQALDGVCHCFSRAGQVQQLRLHGDCHVGNVLWTPGELDEQGESGKSGSPQGGPHFVDFDDARMGPAMQDLWMLLSGDAEDMGQQFRHVLTGYEMFREFDDRELHLIEALRTLRLLHHSAWLARRWDDPAFPAAFPWFATNRYWEERILELREQIARMQEPALIMSRNGFKR
ncbi:serine/threonine protein kinase [Rugosibacter aromaticivorans]|uniref:Stress response kinase A n=1 Tax=Rugosibacter aromaticivorans TaxID=1565605 RepID=A0A0C5J9E4_9PROT|nr:serine/threonine protein kinase [Rugosibacter aromaticivorans]AJP48309.1 serine/threonine protein kinase [Rugosibacter aromaticivorans]TBR15135.1 MAG: serine/threonine protein kinase [Rugosibacter sp.]